MKLGLLPGLSILILAASCSTAEKTLSIRDFQQRTTPNVVQVSYFTATTPDKDTLYIQVEDEIGNLLHKMWLTGVYDDTKPACTVISVNQEEFKKLIDKTIARNQSSIPLNLQLIK